MRTDLFQYEMTQTSAIFGRKAQTRVVFDDEGARTDGRTVYLPKLALGKELDDETIAVMRGYVDHEAGHNRHSDMPILLDAYREWGLRGEGWIARLHNGIEDVWLERRVMRDYPGAERNLRATSRSVNRETLAAIESGELPPERRDNPFAVIGVAITWEGRKDYGGEENGKLIETLPPELAEKLSGYVARTLKCRDTKETLALAQEIADELREEYAEPEAKPKPMPDEGKPEGETTEGEGESEKPEEGEGEEPEGEEGEGEEAEEESRSSAAADEKAEPLDPDMAETVNRKLEEFKPDVARGDYVQPDTSGDRWWHRKNCAGSGHSLITSVLGGGSAALYDEAVRRMTGEISVMRRGLERALLSRMNRDWDAGREMGRLDTRRLVAASAGRPHVFKQLKPREELDTAVTFLVDLSGSMGRGYGSRMQLAADATIGMVEALARTPVAVEVLGFSQVRGYAPEARELVGASRTEKLDQWVFKSFEDRLFEAKGALSMLPSAASGNNCDGEAVMLAYDRLRKRKEKKKVLFVLSDGNPQCATRNATSLYRHLQDSVKYIEGQGVEVVAVGVQTESVRHYYSRCVVVNDLGQLAKATTGLLGGLLLPDRRRGRVA